jgi:hypothetical protein
MSTITDWPNIPYPHPRQLPTEDDIRHSKSIIKKLDHDIRQLQTQLQEVQQKRANHLSYISPLRRLPTEILNEILRICLEDGGNVLEIAGICSRLREVVLGMTGIWSNITLYQAHPDYPYDPQYWPSIDVSCCLNYLELC